MSLSTRVTELVDAVDAVDAVVITAAARRHDELAKPPGSLGRLEALGAQLAGIAGGCPPPLPAEPAVVVAAADHGVHAQGVTAWPQTVTTQMVELLCAGQAGINAVAAAVGARVSVLDVGVAQEPPDHPRLRKARVRAGTADLAAGAAMSPDEAARALLAGAGLAEELVGGGVDLLVTGDMGIANTTASAALIAALTGWDAAAVVGPGAGADEHTLARKSAVVAEAVARAPTRDDPLAVLAALGGLEHAALAGVMLSGAADGVPVILDGVNAVAAALVAVAVCPPAAGYLVAGHRSPEPGVSVALDHLGLVPLLDLGLRLGEGTGAALAVPLVTAAARLLRDVATLADLGASR